MATITFSWEKFEFIPINIDEPTFNSIKQMIKVNPVCNVFQQKKIHVELFLYSAPHFLMAIIVGLGFFFFGYITSRGNYNSINFWEDMILGIVLFLLLGSIVSLYNFFNYLRIYNSYYSKLLVDIKKAYDYSNFRLIRQQRYKLI